MVSRARCLPHQQLIVLLPVLAALVSVPVNWFAG
jgi:hypothetical protein